MPAETLWLFFKDLIPDFLLISLVFTSYTYNSIAQALSVAEICVFLYVTYFMLFYIDFFQEGLQ